jgi:hypothetical protein
MPRREVPRPAAPGPAPLDNLTTARRGSRARDLDGIERDADSAADAARRGSGAPRRRARSPATARLAPPDTGRPLAPAARREARRLGVDPEGVRVHGGEEAQRTAVSLGARAFADGSDIWLGPGARADDAGLMAHELAHVAQGAPGPHLREATWVERRAWKGFFDHYLSRKFLDNYMDDTGAPITLTEREMIDVNPIVDIRRSTAFQAELGALQARATAANAPALKPIDVRGWGGALTNGTLGNFTIRFQGLLTVQPDGRWMLVGAMSFHDFWDFDPKPFGTSGRSTIGELKTRVGTLIPGRPFEVFSVLTVVTQTFADARATWAGGTPAFAGDRATRATVDIGGGVEVGVPTGPGGAAGGGEIGAQAAEDLNP